MQTLTRLFTFAAVTFLSHSTRRVSGQEHTVPTDTTLSLHFVRVHILLGEHHVNMFFNTKAIYSYSNDYPSLIRGPDYLSTSM